MSCCYLTGIGSSDRQGSEKHTNMNKIKQQHSWDTSLQWQRQHRQLNHQWISLLSPTKSCGVTGDGGTREEPDIPEPALIPSEGILILSFHDSRHPRATELREVMTAPEQGQVPGTSLHLPHSHGQWLLNLCSPSQTTTPQWAN